VSENKDNVYMHVLGLEDGKSAPIEDFLDTFVDMKFIKKPK
jgi:hypothetical protein